MKKLSFLAAMMLVITLFLTPAIAGNSKIAIFSNCGQLDNFSEPVQKEVNKFLKLIETSKIEQVLQSSSCGLSNACLTITIFYRE